MSPCAGMMQVMGNSEDISAFNASNPGDGAFRHELEVFLSRASEATTWHVERVIKQSDFETTELVRGCPGAGRAGRYIRKTIDASSGVGGAYEELWRAQEQGMSLACVPRLIECSRNGGTMTVVMEHVDGCTVEELERALGAGEVLATSVLPALCRSVTELHTAFDRPIIHRDLKPTNVIMRGGEAVIIDFGSARTWNPDASTDTTHFLTRCYAPPEQFGFGQTDERTDVYALGKILYFCLTGEQPPNICGAEECTQRGIGGAWAQAIGTACAFDPAARYGSVADFGAAVTAAAGRVPAGVSKRGAGAAPALRESTRVLRESANSRRQSVRVPTWMGRAWNVWVLLMLVAMLWMSVDTIFNPLPQDAGKSVGLLFVQNIVCIDPILIIGSYLMLDRSRIRERCPALARWGVLRETVYGLIVIVAILFGGALIMVLVE